MRLAERVALVTSGTSGIGAAAAYALASIGARVFVASRNPPNSDTLQKINAVFISCDITQDDTVRSLIESVLTRPGRLDLAVNAAGYEGQLTPVHKYPVDDCISVLNVNVIGTFLSLKYEISAMRESGGAAILNVASIAGLKGVANASAYTASKNAVIGLTRATALEAADVPIRVNVVCPSLVDTAMADRISEMSGMSKTDFAITNPIRRFAEPGEVAASICWRLSDDASFVSGQCLGVDGAQSIA